MARTISVKVPVASVIAEVEKKIAEIDKAIASYPSDVEKYDKEVETYKKKVAKFISEFVAKNANKVGFEHDSVIRISTNYSGRLELIFDSAKIEGFPVRPSEVAKPNQSEWIGNKHLNRKEVLEKNLKVLRMTTQEEVNASTYSAVMDLL
jgi:ribosomal protein L18